MKLGVTGLGFIGTTLVNLLLNEGHEVVGMDNRFKENLDNAICFIPNKNFKFILGDITDVEHVKRFYDNEMDYCITTAGIVGFPCADRFKDLAYAVNVKGNENMVRYKPPHVGIVYTGTGSVYKPGQPVCTEESEVDPPSWYGKTKLMGEQAILWDKRSLVHRYATACGVGFSTLRVNLLLNDLCYKAVNERTIVIYEGNFRRVFINIFDLVQAIYVTLQNFDNLLDDNNRIYNVGNNELSLTKLELAHLIQKKTGCHVIEADVFKDKDCRDYGYSSLKFMNKTNWTPKIGLEQTIDDLIKVCPLLTPWNRYN
jgi:nucleoside-diphosphate-sugar epimerase